MSDDTVAFEDVVVKRETDKAILVVVEGEEHWIPKGQIDDDSEVWSQKNGEGRLVISRWIAEQKGLA
mgnify:FL=1